MAYYHCWLLLALPIYKGIVALTFLIWQILILPIFVTRSKMLTQKFLMQLVQLSSFNLPCLLKFSCSSFKSKTGSGWAFIAFMHSIIPFSRQNENETITTCFPAKPKSNNTFFPKGCSLGGVWAGPPTTGGPGGHSPSTFLQKICNSEIC